MNDKKNKSKFNMLDEFIGFAMFGFMVLLALGLLGTYMDAQTVGTTNYNTTEGWTNIVNLGTTIFGGIGLFIILGLVIYTFVEAFNKV